MSLLTQKTLNTGDSEIKITRFEDVNGDAMPIATATQIILYIKDLRGVTLKTYKYVDYTDNSDRIFADSTTAAHIWLPKATADTLAGKTINLCGTWSALNSELILGTGQYDFDLENITINKCQ